MFNNDTKDTTSTLSEDLLNQSTLTKLENYSLENFLVELEKEISVNQQAQIEFIKSKFDYKAKSIMQNLSFNMNSLSETSTNDSIKYKTQLLETQNEDYQFILRSIIDENSNHNPTVRYIFRINHVDLNEVEKLKNSFLYLQGVKANKVMNVLKFGYPKDYESLRKQCKEECFGEYVLRNGNCSCKVSTLLDEELPKGVSYCKVQDKVKKLLFVLVASEGLAAATDHFSISSDNNLDSRGCAPAYGSFRNHNNNFHLPTEGMVPAYLIVFNM